MVIRTEYKGERYSMGSSDPLLAGFEIRFGSLNIQATGNGYLMRITNRAELHPWRPTGPGPVTTTPTAVPSTRTARCCRPFSTLTPTPFWPTLTQGANGTTSGRTCRVMA
jgi:hypothetical protein